MGTPKKNVFFLKKSAKCKTNRVGDPLLADSIRISAKNGSAKTNCWFDTPAKIGFFLDSEKKICQKWVGQKK